MISGSVRIDRPTLIDESDDGHVSRVFNQHIQWFILPSALIEELRKFPWEQIGGQGVLVRDAIGNTALISIAEAAALEQHHFIPLLESLLFAIEVCTLDNYTGVYAFPVSWNYKDYKPLSSTMYMCATTDEQQRVLGIDSEMRDREYLHWLSLEVMYGLEWIQKIVLSAPSQDLFLVQQSRLTLDSAEETRGRVTREVQYSGLRSSD